MQHSRDERASTVNGIDHPSESTPGLDPMFLTEDPVRGVTLEDPLPDRLFSSPIRFGDRIEPTVLAFVVCRRVVPEERSNDVSCLDSERDGALQEHLRLTFLYSCPRVISEITRHR